MFCFLKSTKRKNISIFVLMNLLKIPFLLFWRLWFYVLLIITILFMVPFLFVLTAKESYYPTFWKMVRIWAKIIIYGMGFRLKIDADEVIDESKSYMFCPNHSSLMDPFIMILMSKKPIIFIGKQELVKIPIFGFFYKRVVIMVNRTSLKSRKRVYEMAKRRLQNGVSMAIFPEGLVPTENVILSPFKNGAFSLAIEFKIPIVPQVYYDGKRLFSWDFLKGGPGTLRIHQHKFLQTSNLELSDMEDLKQKTFDIIYDDLISDEKYMKDTNRSNNEREFKSPLS